jgi:hypothetical protein
MMKSLKRSRQTEAKPLSLDVEFERQAAIRKVFEETSRTREEQLGEMTLLLMTALWDDDRHVEISGHYDYVHQADEAGFRLPKDGPNVTISKVDRREQSVKDMRFTRGYVLDSGKAVFSQVVFVNEQNQHYVFRLPNISSLGLCKHTAMEMLEQIDGHFGE